MRLGRGLASLAGPRAAAKLLPLAAAGKLRDIVRDGTIGKLDLDILRAEWERGTISADQCITLGATGDANGDGCVDIVDLQAAVVRPGQLRRRACQLRFAQAAAGRERATH